MSQFSAAYKSYKQKKTASAMSDGNLLTLAGQYHDRKNSGTYGYTSLSDRWEDLYKRAVDYYNNEAYTGFFGAYSGTRNKSGYVADTDSWYSTLEKLRDTANEDVDELLAELDQYSRYYNEDAVSYVRDLITKRKNSYDEVLKDAGTFRDHWSQWATEGDYNNAVWESNFLKLVEDGKYDEAQASISAQMDTFKQTNPEVSFHNNPEAWAKGKKLDEYNKYLQQMRENAEYKPFWDAVESGDFDTAEAFLNEKTENVISGESAGESAGEKAGTLLRDTQATAYDVLEKMGNIVMRGFQRLIGAEESPAIDDTSTNYYHPDTQEYWDILNFYKEEKAYRENNADYLALRENEDFAENSKYITTKTSEREIDWLATAANAAYNGLMGNPGVEYVYKEGQGYGDITYDIINGNDEAKRYADEKNLSDYGALAVASGLASIEYLTELTDEEKEIFNYLYHTEGEEKAYQYISHLEKNYLNERSREAIEKKWSELAREAPVLTSLLTVGTAPARGASYIGQAVDFLQDGKIEDNARYNQLLYSTNAVRTQVSKDIEASGKWGEVGSFAYNVGMSMGDFLMSTVVGFGNGTAVGLIMATSAAADTTLQGIDRGLDSNRAFALGTIAGAAEFFTEKMGVENLLDKALLSKSKFAYVLKNALSEGAEEGITDLINWTADSLYDLISGQSKSEWKAAIAKYEAMGYTAAEAFGKALGDRATQLGTDVLAGAVSGGIMGGAGAAFQAIGEYREGAKYKADPSGLINNALGLNPDSEYAQKLQDRLEMGKKVGQGALGKLSFEMQDSARTQLSERDAATREQFRVDVEKKLSTQIADKQQRSRMADTITKIAYGEHVSNAELRRISQSQKALNVLEGVVGAKYKAGEVTVRDLRQAISPLQDNAARLSSANVLATYAEHFNMDEIAERSLMVSYANDVKNAGESAVIAPEVYAEAYNKAYVAGKKGTEISKISGNITSVLSDSAIAQAYRAGEMVASVTAKSSAQGNAKAAPKATTSKGDLLGSLEIGKIDSNKSYYKLDDLGISKADQAAWVAAGIAQERNIRGEKIATVNTTVLQDELKRREKSSAKVLQNDGGSDTIESTQSQKENGDGEENQSRLLRRNTVSSGEGSAEISGESRGTPRNGTSSGIHAEPRRVGILSEDTEGRQISPQNRSKISETSVVDSDGRPVSLYHATDKNFDTFAIGDIGFHFGSKSQADTRAADKKIASPRYVNAYLNIKNPLRVKTDYMNWHANSVAMHLWNEGIISDAEMQSVTALWSEGKNYDSPAAIKLREILESKGYDGIAYPNGYEGEGMSYIAFHDEQIIRIDGEGRQAKESTGDFDEFYDDTENTDSDIQHAHSSGSSWDAERIKDGKVKDAKPVSEIIEEIRRKFGINITKGHVRGKNVLGQYNKRDHGIRTKIANDLPTVAHELGHALDQRYGLTGKGKLSKEMRAELINALGDLKDSYKQNLWVSEGLAEYMRRFLQNRDDAARAYPEFTKYFLNSLSKSDRVLVDTFADEINAYYALDADTATSSIRLREEGTPDARTPLEKAREMGDDIYQAWVDANHGIRLFDEATGADTYKLASNAAYSDAIAGQIIVGDLTDANGQYVAPGLKAALEGVDIGNKKTYREFGEYLVLKHGPERLNEGMMIFADPRKNTAAFMEKRAAELETVHPEFAEAANRLYDFQKQFLKTWAVDTGLLPAEVAEAWAERWSCYVPLNRAVGKAGTIGAKRGYANQNNTIKKAMGSGLDIVHPVDNIINNIVKMVNAGVRNNVMLEITGKATEMGADATFLEKVPTPMKKKTADLTGVKAKLHDAFGGAGIDELLAEKERESAEYSYHKSFSEQIDDVVSGEHNPVYDLYVGKTPDVLVKLGFANQPLLMRNSKIKEILNDHSDMDVDLIKKIPGAVADPVMILKSKTHPKESVVVLTDITTSKGHMIIPVWVSQDGTYLDVEIGKSIPINTNFVASAYGRNVKGLIEYALKNNEVLFYAEDKNRVSTLLATHGLQLPARLSIADSSISIARLNQNVNKKFSTNLNNAQPGAWSKVDEIIESAIDDVLIQYGQGKAHGDVVTVLRNGKQEFWKINDALLLESLTSLSQKKMSGIMEAYAVVSRFMTSNITGNNIVWSIFSNFPRDLMTFFTYSKQKNPLKALPAMGEAYLNKITGGNADTKHLPYIKEYYALGGGQTSAYTADVDLAKRARKKLKTTTKWQSATYYFNPLNTLSFISETVESGPRISTYIMMREQGMSPQEAFYESQDITVNFKRGGRLAREFNKVVPFFNASVQGLDKFKRWITCADVPRAQRSKAIVGRVAMYVAVSAALGALMYAINNADDDDEENYRLLSNYTKNTYWNIPLGDGKYFAIPKPREIAVLSTFFETSCEYFGGNDYAYDEFGDYVADNFLPPFVSDFVTDGMDGALGSLGMIGVASDLKANKDFLGRPIESASLQAYESRDRYTRRTSYIAYWLGQAAAELGLDWSPVQIDYFFSQTLGGYWKWQKALFPVGRENVDWTLGVQNTYVKDNQYSNDIINWMYTQADESAMAHKSNPNDMDIAIGAKLDSNMQSFYSKYYALTKNKKETAESRIVKRAVLDMISGYRTVRDSGDHSAAEEAVYEVVRLAKDTGLLPAVMQTTVKDGEKNEITLTDVEYYEYQTRYNALYWEIIESNLGAATTDAEKVTIIKQAQSIAKSRATEEILKTAGAVSSGEFDKYPGIDDDDLVTFKTQVSVETARDGGLTQSELIEILEKMVADGLSMQDAYTLFKSRYPDSDKNNPWHSYAP